MTTNKGLIKETRFVNALNGKKVGDLNNNLRSTLIQIYDDLDDEEVVNSGIIMGFQKPDIYVECKGRRVNISLKTGRSNVVHEDNIKNFILFLRSKGISKRTQQTLLLFHYGDKTLDGTGEKRYDALQLNYWLRERIIEANNELNSSHEFIQEFIERFVFTGSEHNDTYADALYHGELDYGHICSKKQILKHIGRRKYDFIRAPHVGPIIFRPHARYVDKEIKQPRYREIVDLYWRDLGADIEYISERYNFN